MDVMTARDTSVEPVATTAPHLPPLVATVSFANGLIGCPDWKSFELRGDFAAEPVGLLVSRDDPERIFFVTPLESAAPGGLGRFNNEDTRALRREGAGQRDDVLALATLNVDDAGNLTVNLLGPLVIDMTSGQGKQLVLSDVTLSTRHRLLAGLSDGAE